jgi:hypothetical protein
MLPNYENMAFVLQYHVAYERASDTGVSIQLSILFDATIYQLQQQSSVQIRSSRELPVFKKRGNINTRM